MFAGLMSRWTIPFECAASRASAIWMPRSSTGSISSGLPAIRCRSVCPSRSSIGNKRSPIRLVNVVDGADVRVVQGGRSLRLPLETAESLCIVGEFFGKEFQGDVAIELEVFRFVDHTHAPAAQLPQDAVMRDGAVHHRTPKRHRYYCGRAMRVKRDRMPPFQLARREVPAERQGWQLGERSVESPILSQAIAVSQKQSPSVFNLLPRSRLKRVFGRRSASLY